MSWYSDYRYEWKEIIETVAREYGRAEIMVEKDTVQSFFLSELSKSELPFVFKGGTSLAKAYGIIDRFSEDIDLSMTRKLTESEKKSSKEYIMKVADCLGMEIVNPEQIKSRYDYNMYVFQYNSLFADKPMEIIIETSYYQKVYPVKKHEVESLVGKFCKENAIELPIPFDAASVIMNVQAVERTFIDKIFAVCDYRIQNKQDRESRHLYDICKILPMIKFDENLEELIKTVRKDRMLSKNNPSAQPIYNITEMLKEIMSSRFYEQDYRNITQKLLHEDLGYDYVIDHGIALVADADIFSTTT